MNNIFPRSSPWLLDHFITCTKWTHLKTSKINDDEVWSFAVETRLWYQEVGRLQVDPQVQNFPGLNHVR